MKDWVKKLRLKPLHAKILRDLKGMYGQALAVAMVAGCGVALLVMMQGTLTSLEDTRAAYYDRYRMADIWAPVRRAPKAILTKIAAIDGVARVEGRIKSGALLDLDGVDEPITARILSLPEHGRPLINNVHIAAGRYIRPGYPDEIVLADDFMTAHGLIPGDTIQATIYGVKRTLHIVGAGLSPEYVYAIPPGEIVPNAKRFAVMWMGEEALAFNLNMDGAFSEATLMLERGAREEAVIAAVDHLLAPYGARGAYALVDQFSNKFIQSELDQLKVIGRILPPIFLLVAAFLLNIVITRIVEQEREQIGLMKAFGYRKYAIAVHYVTLAMIIVGTGILFGWYFGAMLGRGLAALYMDFFKFPLFIFRPGAGIFVVSGAVAAGAGLAGALAAVNKVLALAPAVAMAPAAPTDYGGRATRFGRSQWFDQTTRLIIRHLMRWPVRASLTALGISLAMAILVSSQSMNDSVYRMMDLQFNIAERQDATVVFSEPQERAVLHDIERLPGVLKVEPFRVVPAKLINGSRAYNQSLTGMLPNPTLSRLTDTNDMSVPIRSDGVTLSDKLAEMLDLKVGDRLQVDVKEGARPNLNVRVANIVPTYLGTPAYMQITALNRAMKEGRLVSGAYLMVDTNLAPDLYRRLKDMPGVAGVNLKQGARESMQKTMDEFIGTMTFFNTLFAGLIAVGVVFSSARVSYAERRHEIAGLRVLGFTRVQVNVLLMGELAIQTAVALPLGALLGYALTGYMAHNMSSELFRIPVTVSNGTLGTSVITILIAAMASGWIIARQIKSLDLVAALKTRE